MYTAKLKWILAAALILFTQLSFAQKMEDYKNNWKKVEDFEKKGLTKSAKEEVLNIFEMATRDKQDAQQIKAAIYLIKYRQMVEEDSHENNIFFVDTLIEKANAPAKNILQSMQAGMFWQYVQNNRWKFYNRTQLAEEKSRDIATWSIEKLHKTIGELYTASLQNSALLKTTKLENYEPVIIRGENTRNLRPTLFDFLSHRALDYFCTDEKDIKKPAYAFTITDEKAFAPAASFVNASFKTKDTASLYHTAILLFQDILKFHLQDASPDALVDADIRRLQFMSQYAVIPEKEKLYESALKAIETKYASNAVSAMAGYLRANIYFERGQSYDPFTKTEAQFELKRAKELCEAITAKFPESEGGINAYNLILQIKAPSLSLNTERVNIPGQPFRTLVNFKNIKTLYLRVIKTTREELKKLDRRDYDKIWKAYAATKPVRSWSVQLPDLQDHQEHSLEIKVDALNNGLYIILAGMDENFSLSNNAIAKQVTYVSNLSTIHNGNDYYVVNRDNGQPMPNTKVQVWESRYNYKTGNDDDKKAEEYTTNANGYFKFTPTTEYRNVSLQLTNGKDELFLDDNIYSYANYNSYNEPEPRPYTYFFTDRSIYRPGQTVFFKGIVLKVNRNTKRSEIVSGYKTSVQLKDANGQKLKDVDVTSNEFGSFNGSFKLPEGLLNGQFSVYDNSTLSTRYFNVEEYKRPKFFAEIEKPKGTYRVNDSITVTGTAKAFAGNNIDGAMVKYRVMRKVQYPIWWGWWGYSRGRGKINPGISSEGQEISSGNITTDAKGEFKVTFKAIPDAAVKKSDQPTFYYEVSADITDINGETRSSSTTVAVAYQAIQLDIDVPAKLEADSLKSLIVKSTNMNGIEEKTTATLTIEKLKNPAKVFRERLWNQPDLFLMSKESYYNDFPYDVYKDENEVQRYLVEDKIQERKDSTNEPVNIRQKKLQAGWYKLTAVTKDKYGEEARVEKYIQLTDAGIQKEPISIKVKRSTLEPGEKIQYSIASGFDKIWLVHSRNFMNDKKKVDYESLGNNSKQFEIPVTEADRGGISMNYVFVQHNRVYTGGESFSIPWSNKQLNISYNTFRDKLLPGANEKWSIKISGSKGEKVAAEMLTAMYDASLDQFKPHSWYSLNLWPTLYNNTNWQGIGFDEASTDAYVKFDNKYKQGKSKSYDYLAVRKVNNDIETMWWLNPNYNSYRYEYFANALQGRVAGLDAVVVSGYSKNKSVMAAAPMMKAQLKSEEMKSTADTSKRSSLDDRDANAVFDPLAGDLNGQLTKPSNDAPVQVRKNFNETAFFFPELKTDADGNVEFSFTIPEALTKWKMMTLAYTKELASVYSEKTVVTQKPLMVQPNAPRFLREGDRMEFSAKIVNMSDSEVTGTAQLELIDAATGKAVDGWFKNIFPSQYFTIAAGQSSAVKFPIEIPFNFNSALTYRIIAKTNNASDGEEMAMPVLTNRMLVTESLPINMRQVTKKDFKFDKLISSGSSSTIKTNALTVEYTSNPAWYAVQALPYLMEYPYECAEQTFNRYYANALASFISNSAPKIKSVFEKWRTLDTAALLSNLQKNEELKSALLQETPWVLEAQNENQQKKNIALLFDMVKMSSEMDKAFNKLKEMQSPNGGFVWFKGGRDDRYMTQYIITGIGHLKKLGVLKDNDYAKVKNVVDKAVSYLDQKIKEEYDDLIRYKVKLSENNLSYTAIQYLYMRSFFQEYEINSSINIAVAYYKGQAKKYWLSQSKYMQAMIALALYRDKDAVTASAITRSLKENAIFNAELGMYWKEFNTGGYYWYQSPIESQAMMVEAFADIDKNMSVVDDLKTWLLKNKQTSNWKTTKATAEACYALLLNGSNWLSEEKEVSISLGTNTVIKSTDAGTEAGTGYFKKRIEGDRVTPQMGNISVTIKPVGSKTPPLGGGGASSWGSVYWQYFEDLDKITPAETPLKLTKKLFVETNGDKGPVLTPINDGDEIKVGDKIKVRIELKVDRDMEYVHMKDMRAACMEPVNVISEYKWQGGLGYYESTKDASTNFFFGWLNRGTYVFEYPMFVTHAGYFSNGITTIQCMYAPEFTSHSEGVRVNVE